MRNLLIISILGPLTVGLTVAGCTSSSQDLTATTTTTTTITTTTTADPAPSRPYGFSATAGDGYVLLNWSVVLDDDLASYNVYRSLTSGGTLSNINTSLVTVETYRDNNVTNTTTYYYKITALDDAGNESEYSSEVSIMPKEIYTMVATWGTMGSGEGEFNGPYEIAIDADGNVLVSEYTNKRIQRFDKDGNYLSSITSYETNEFISLYGIDVDASGNIYACHHDNTREAIIVFNSSGVYQKKIGDNMFFGLREVAIGDDGYVYAVEDCTAPELYIFDASGSFVRKWSASSISSTGITGLAVDSDSKIYISSFFQDEIRKYDVDGNLLKTVSIDEPRGIAIDGNSKVYILGKFSSDSSFSYSGITKTSTNIEYITSWRNTNDAFGLYHCEGGIAVDGNGDVYVTEHKEILGEDYRVIKYSRSY